MIPAPNIMSGLGCFQKHIILSTCKILRTDSYHLVQWRNINAGSTSNNNAQSLQSVLRFVLLKNIKFKTVTKKSFLRLINHLSLV